ncbi:unnamed protein product, partial [Tilletia laevis]
NPPPANAAQPAEAEVADEENDNETDWGPEDEDEEDDQLTPDAYSIFIWQELEPQRMAFATLQDLRSWRSLGDLRTGGAVRHIDRGRNTLAEANPHQLLGFLLIETSKMECFVQAGIMSELLVILYRFRFEQDPTPNRRMELCMALGALSVTLARTDDRRLESIRAIEEAIHLFTPLEELIKEFADYIMGMFRLSQAYALLAHKGSLTIMSNELPLYQTRKALRCARSAVADFRSHLAADLPGRILGTQAALARALHACALIGKVLLKEMESHQTSHDPCAIASGQDRCYPPFKQTPRERGFTWDSWCKEHLYSPEQEYVHAKMGDYSLGLVEDFAAMAEEAVGLYRNLARTNQELYEPLLAEVLKLQAQLLDLRPEKAIPVCEEAIETFERISSTFVDHFKEPLAALYLDLTRHLRSGYDLEKTISAIDEAISHQERLHQRFSIWRGYDTISALTAARALVHIRLERYEEALLDAEKAEQKLLEEVARDDWIQTYLVEPRAVKAFILWMTGQTEQALVELQSILEATMARDAASLTSRRKTYWASDDPNHILFRGWLGGVRAAAGDAQGGRQDGEQAVQNMRRLLDTPNFAPIEEEDAARARLVIYSLDTIDHILPHLLVLLAATLAQLGEFKEAMDNINEALELSKMHKCRDESTMKTALLLKLRLLERSEGAESQQIQKEAYTIVAQGFLAQLGCSSHGSGINT